MCNNSCNGGNLCWLIVLLLLFCSCGSTGYLNGGCNCNCNCGSSSGCGGCGCGGCGSTGCC